jgi:glycosyltransferase involved in cell wall biosynthesis
MRIAFLTTMGIPARYGGFETCVEEVATRLVKKGHEVIVYYGYKGSKPQMRMYKGIQLIHISCLKSKFLDFPFRAFISALDVLHRNADIAHFYGSDAWPFVLLPRLISSKTVLSLDGLVWNRRSYPSWVRNILRSTAGFALYTPKLTTVDSRSVQYWYHQNYSKPPIYVPYGANIDLTEPDEKYLRKMGLEKGKYVLFVGRLVREKGVHHLVKAFGKIKTDFKLVIVGSDPYNREYESFLKTIASENTLFLGYVYGKRCQDLYKGAYLYVTPSELEGTSPALLTAMALGKCVLVSDIPENIETVDKVGFFFKHGNSQDLQDKLQFLLLKPEVVKKAGLRAIEHVSVNYNWDKITDQLEKIYFSLIR